MMIFISVTQRIKIKEELPIERYSGNEFYDVSRTRRTRSLKKYSVPAISAPAIRHIWEETYRRTVDRIEQEMLKDIRECLRDVY